MTIITIDDEFKFRRTAWFLVGIFFLLIPSPVRAGELAEQIRATIDQVLAILQDPRLKPEARKKDRRAQLQQVIEPRFDFEEMAKRSMGSHWQGRSREEQGKFETLFTDLLAESYLDKIESYVGEQFVYLRETQDGKFSEVETKIVDTKGEVPINYKLHSVGGKWKIYDVVIENVSLVNNYRSQFNRILTATSFDELLERLQEERGKEIGSERLRLNTIVSYSIMSAAAAARSR